MKKNTTTDNKTTPKVIAGVQSPTALNPYLKKILAKKRKTVPTTDHFVEGIFRGDKVILSQAITLIESTKPTDQKMAEAIIERCLPKANQSVRIGVTGTPGVGKSTFIESFGHHLVAQGKRLAVLAVDPSSQISGGSILGDKTRMEKLASQPNVFVRPSPAKSSLGGVARKTRETMMLCEAAGFDTILVETVGVGQSETLVHSMVDFFLLLLLPGSGDELQGIKRGIVEMADLVLINKADGDRVALAKKTKVDYRNALHLFPAKESHWTAKALVCSALTNDGIAEVWKEISGYFQLTKKNKYFENNRKRQAKYWLMASINEGLQNAFFKNEQVKTQLKKIEEAVLSNELSPFQGAHYLLQLFQNP
ncbi:MAG: methylmalonyl Co-A mutase-associated GTPase MeaB [Bacteroidota bacterium]